MKKLAFHAVLVSGLLAFIAPSWAADAVHPPKSTTDTADESWSYQPPSSATNARAIVQEKAEVRSAQRMERLAAQNWYGDYAGRPSASATPFTQPRASWWDRPHQLPNAWYQAVQRPNTLRVDYSSYVAQRGYQPVMQ